MVQIQTRFTWVFEDLSFEVNEKENVAIVGENGSGKTTLIKL